MKQTKQVELSKELSEETCPVCGYYCLGNGGIGCIDKLSAVEQTEQTDWEREFDKMFPNAHDVRELKAFITEAIAKAQQEAVERVESLRKTDRFPQSLTTYDGKTKTFDRLSDADINYNKALDDALKALQKEQE